LFGFPLLRDNNGQLITTAGLGGTFNNFAGFLFGLVGNQAQTQFFNQNQERVDNNFRGFRVREFDMYFQDTWRIRPNFTINYGVRYEVKGVPYEVNGLLSTLVDQDPSGFLPKGGFLFQQVGKNAPNERLQLYDDDFNNVAPRIGFAWDPFKTGKTSIRGGYGIFYDRVFGNLFTNARGNLPFEFGFTDFPATRSFDEALVQNIPRPATVMTRSNALTDDELSPVIFPQRGNNSFQKEFRNPYTQNFSLGIQRQVLSDLVVELDYVGVKGTKLLNVVDGNLTNVARKNLITGANRPVSNSLRQNFLNGTLNTAFNIAFLNLTSGFSTYHALTLRVTKLINSPRFGFGQIQGAYTYSHSIDNTEDPLSPTDTNRSLPRDSSGFAGGSSAERGDSGNDSRNRFVMNFVYEFPFKAENRILNALISRFTIGGIVTAQSGNPFSVFFNGLDTQGTGVSARARFAPDGVAGITPSRNLNPRLQTGPLSSLFLAPSNALLDGRPGNVPRGAFVGPGFARADFNVGKKFNLGETRTATARVDFFNLFNRVNLGQPINLVNDPRFGQSLTAGQSRVIQLVFRYDF
jgi:hypothetical protein